VNAIPSRSLAVCLDRRLVGTLTDTNGVWSLAYEREWQEAVDAFDLAPSLPRHRGCITDSSSERPVQWFFDNLLPEDLQREVFASLAHVDRGLQETSIRAAVP
jgi:serine/threonine-protein kinase HipA